MRGPLQWPTLLAAALVFCLLAFAAKAQDAASRIGREVAVPHHLQDGEEYQLSIPQLIAFGEKLFTARWTIQEGAGRPLSKGTANGAKLSDPSSPLVFPSNFNRLSGPEANSCSGCHNLPSTGGGGDRVTNVFVLGQRFDFISFNHNITTTTVGAVDESGNFVTQQTFANERKTIGMHGSGFIEMLARQMTADLQAIRDSIAPGAAKQLASKGVSFGTLARRPDGTWDTSQVQGLAAPCLLSSDANHPPSLLVMPFHQAGAAVSLRQFSINALNQHHGIQAEERFGLGIDEDGDGFVNELTTADVTAVSIYQATLPVPGRVIPNDPEIEKAVRAGEQLFSQVGCASCHISSLPLTDKGWMYSEPNPYNPPGNLRPGDAASLAVDLTRNELPGPRLKPDAHGVVWVPAFTDLKLHNITTGRSDPNAEPLDQNQPTGSSAFFQGNTKFITRKLWGAANSGPFFHHGKFTTLREAVLAHSGEALASRQAFEDLSRHERDCIIEFLKTLQVLPQGAASLILDENAQPKNWPHSRN